MTRDVQRTLARPSPRSSINVKREHANAPLAARTAIEQVLQAERLSAAAIEAARDEAGALMARATEEAQRIARRCESRMQRVHERCAAVLEQQLRQLQTSTDSAADGIAADPMSRDEIEAAVMRLAASLTSGDS